MAKTKRSKLWKIALGVFAIYFCFSLFRSSTKLVGLTNEPTSHYYFMTRNPNSWDIFWGNRALDLWKYFPNYEDLAVALVKGNTLIGLKKADVREKIGVPEGGDANSNWWIYFLESSSFEYGSHVNLIFNENDVVTGTSFYVSP
ncbi:MAG: hypothetical protein SFY67_07120 [Candidatus Melainabacteria bacterium]|nr:hypothetical protein [Candidatus Melainabacteria bacterium]